MDEPRSAHGYLVWSRLLRSFFVRCAMWFAAAALIVGLMYLIYGYVWPALLGAVGAISFLSLSGRWHRLFASFRLTTSLVGSCSSRKNVQFQGDDGAIVVRYDDHGIPEISADSYADALHGLGYCHARDRLFQMDWLRRSALGTMAEVVGPRAVASDVVKRRLGLARVARTTCETLDRSDYALLQSYSAGINRAALEQRYRPFEARLLGYEVQAWRAEDTMAVALSLFETLAFDYEAKRGLAILRTTLPAQTVRLLYAEEGETDAAVVPAPWPVDVADCRKAAEAEPQKFSGDSSAGASNLWAISGYRSATGQGILCNDLHLPLSVPNIFYCARVHFADRRLAGTQVPGLPITLTGTNGYISWGVANLGSSCVDLVRLELSQDHPDSYDGPSGSEAFVSREESIAVKGRPPVTTRVEESAFGPVMERNFLGAALSVRWTALIDGALSLDLMRLVDCRTVEHALDLAARSGGPSLSFCASSRSGEIGRTICGRIPDRLGSVGEMRAARDASWRWVGFVPPKELPRERAPQDGFFVSANQKLYPFQHGLPEKGSFSDGWRARRARDLLLAQERHSAAELQRLQLDIQCPRFFFYRDLILSLAETTREDRHSTAWVATVVQDARAWHGNAQGDSIFFGFLSVFSELLSRHLLDCYVRPCKDLDRDFNFPRRNVERAISAILAGESPRYVKETPDRSQNSAPTLSRVAAQALLLSLAQEAYERTYRATDKQGQPLSWGELNAAAIQHPLSAVLGTDRAILDMPSTPQDGCPDSVKVAKPSFGSAGRLILVSGAGEMHVQFPCGQSGHPLSRHYADMHRYWTRGDWIRLTV